MGQLQVALREQLPSFSIVLETENLANADIDGLSKSLASLENQNLSPTYANEVFLIDSGDAPASLLKLLTEKYPWLKVYQAPMGTSYYKAKMLGAELATGEIVVYFDSDCIYESNWLKTILTTFIHSENIQVVAGETMTRGVGVYGTAMVMSYIFPPFSGQKNITETSQYFLNNVAFRKEFILKNPIPFALPLYRGHCAIHAHRLCQQGYKIWKQPQARATHAPPSGLSHFFWRFLLIGHDYFWQKRILAAEIKKLPSAKSYRNSMSGIKGKLQVFSDRFGRMLAHDPRHLIYIPFALPLALFSAALVAIGYFITLLKSDYLLKVYTQMVDEF